MGADSLEASLTTLLQSLRGFGWFGAQFTAANSEYLSHAGNAVLRGAVGGWWRAGWIYLSSTGVTHYLWDCSDGSTTGSYLLVNGANFLGMAASNTGGMGSVLGSTPMTGSVWHFFYAEYDGTNLGVSVDNEVLQTAVLGGAYAPGTDAYNLGSNRGHTSFLNGRLDGFCGGDGILTAAERTALYNSGVGLQYDDADATLLADTGFWWDLEESSGDRTDEVAGYVLTDHNTVTQAAGVPYLGTSICTTVRRADWQVINGGSSRAIVVEPGSIEFDSEGTTLTGDSDACDFTVNLLIPYQNDAQADSELAIATDLIVTKLRQWPKLNGATHVRWAEVTKADGPSELFDDQGNGPHWWLRRLTVRVIEDTTTARLE